MARASNRIRKRPERLGLTEEFFQCVCSSDPQEEEDGSWSRAVTPEVWREVFRCPADTAEKADIRGMVRRGVLADAAAGRTAPTDSLLYGGTNVAERVEYVLRMGDEAMAELEEYEPLECPCCNEAIMCRGPRKPSVNRGNEAEAHHDGDSQQLFLICARCQSTLAGRGRQEYASELSARNTAFSAALKQTAPVPLSLNSIGTHLECTKQTWAKNLLNAKLVSMRKVDNFKKRPAPRGARLLGDMPPAEAKAFLINVLRQGCQGLADAAPYMEPSLEAGGPPEMVFLTSRGEKHSYSFQRRNPTQGYHTGAGQVTLMGRTRNVKLKKIRLKVCPKCQQKVKSS